jgi:hypothetical protein
MFWLLDTLLDVLVFHRRSTLTCADVSRMPRTPLQNPFSPATYEAENVQSLRDANPVLGSQQPVFLVISRILVTLGNCFTMSASVCVSLR